MTAHGYSRTWLAEYGRSLTRDEIRLVQGFRGLNRSQQQNALTYMSDRVIERASPPLRQKLADDIRLTRKWTREMGQTARGGAR
jgi:hypothetical protein